MSGSIETQPPETAAAAGAVPTYEIEVGGGARVRVAQAASAARRGSRLAAGAVTVAVLAILLRAVTQDSPADLDMFHQLALAREALSVGVLPLEDPFSYTSTVRPFVHHEWGAGMVLYGVAIAAGLGASGIIALKYLLILLLSWFTYRCARLRGADHVAMAMTAPVAALLLASGMATVRAQLYTFAAVAGVLFILELHRRGERGWLLAIPPIYLLWLNLHGGFVVGLGLVGIYTVEQVVRTFAGSRSLRDSLRLHADLIVTVAALMVLPLLNPYGVEYVRVVFDALLVDRQMVAEWAPIWDPRVPAFVRLGFAATLPFLLYAAARRGPSSLEQLPLIGVTMIAALGAQRFFPIYAIAWFAYVPGYLSGTPIIGLARTAYRRHRPVVALAAAAVASGLLLQTAKVEPWRLRLPATATTPGQIHYPVGAVAYLEREGFTGNLMTPFDAGSYVMWTLFPAVRVGMDSRYEAVYTSAAVEESHRLYSASPGWQDLLDLPTTDAVLVPTITPLATAMEREELPGWRLRYADPGYRVYVRSERAEGMTVLSRTDAEEPGAFP